MHTIILHFSQHDPSVHGEDGSRVGCGILEPIGDSFTHLTTTTTPHGDGSTTTGEASVVGNDMFLCYAGMAQGLEADILSFLDGGADCNVTNGCGTHMHSGNSCDSVETQGGHWYETAEDPWLIEGYLSTTTDGMAYFGRCLMVGAATSMAENQPFVIHDSMGGRVSCGILESFDAVPGAPTPSMEPPPTTDMPPTEESSSVNMLTASMQTLVLLIVATVFN